MITVRPGTDTGTYTVVAGEIYAVNVQSNHVHAVIRAEHTAERVMNDLKA